MLQVRTSSGVRNFENFLHASDMLNVTHINHSFAIFKLLAHRSGTRDILKEVKYLSLSKALFLLLCQFHMNLIMQNSRLHSSSTCLSQFDTGNRFHGKALTGLKVIFSSEHFPLHPLRLHPHSPNYFAKPPPRFSVCTSGQANRCRRCGPFFFNVC